jgi:putative transposase
LKYQRKRTKPKDIAYSLYLYFLGLSYRNTTAKALQRFVHKSHVSIWKWIQKYRPKKILTKRKKIDEFILDETLIRIGSRYVWLWVAIEPVNKQILQVDISFERTMLVAERFIASLINTYGNHPVSTDGGTWYPPQACQFLKLKHHLHSSLEKSIIERTMQYIKDRTEGFDDYFPCNRKKKCKLKHIRNWFNLFITQHNKQIMC